MQGRFYFAAGKEPWSSSLPPKTPAYARPRALACTGAGSLPPDACPLYSRYGSDLAPARAQVEAYIAPDHIESARVPSSTAGSPLRSQRACSGAHKCVVISILGRPPHRGTRPACFVSARWTDLPRHITDSPHTPLHPSPDLRLRSWHARLQHMPLLNRRQALLVPGHAPCISAVRSARQ
jgi:hypothetical protein